MVDDLRETVHIAAQGLQAGILLLLAPEEEDERMDHRQRLAQRGDLVGLQKCALDARLFEKRIGIDEAAVRKSALHHQRRAHLERPVEPFFDGPVVGAEFGGFQFLDRALRHAQSLDLAPDAIESYLAFEIFGINHVFGNLTDSRPAGSVSPGRGDRRPIC